MILLCFVWFCNFLVFDFAHFAKKQKKQNFQKYNHHPLQKGHNTLPNHHGHYVGKGRKKDLEIALVK